MIDADLATYLFDYGVNSRSRSGSKDLQRLLNVLNDRQSSIGRESRRGQDLVLFLRWRSYIKSARYRWQAAAGRSCELPSEDCPCVTLAGRQESQGQCLQLAEPGL